MPATELTVQTQSSLYPTAFLNITWTAADIVNGNYYLASGRETILVRNVSEDTAADVTIDSTPDRLGRTGDLTDEIGFGEQRTVRLGVKGWRDQTTLQVALTAETVDIEFAILRDPA